MANPEYNRQRRNTQRRLKGKRLVGGVIAKIGSPISARMNCPTLVPIQFENGKFGILWGEKDLDVMRFDTPAIRRAVRNSTKMPRVDSGIGSDVVHIVAYPSRKGVKYAFIKYFYNGKADRGDTIQYIKA